MRAGATALAMALSTGGADAVNIETVVVGNPGNPADTNRFGAVPSSFRIGKFEVTNAQYVEFLNAVDPNGLNPNGLHNSGMHNDNCGGITLQSGYPVGSKYTAKIDRGNKPVTYMNWFRAARFINWLHNGQPIASNTADSYNARETGAYTLNNATNGIILRNAGAKWWIPSEDQWYKAAYYKGGGSNLGTQYWTYATASHVSPGSVTASSDGNGRSTGNSANYGKLATWFIPSPGAGGVACPTSVGTNGRPGFYGTFDMGGNAAEINDAVFATARGSRGGGFADSIVDMLASSFRGTTPLLDTGSSLAMQMRGFRVASGIDPVLNATSVGTIYSNGVAVSSNLTDSGGGTLIERGFIYADANQNSDPYLGGAGVMKVVTSGLVTGPYSQLIKVLSPGQTYNIRAYATTGVSSGYGAISQVTTLGSGDNSAPTDIRLSSETIVEGNTPPTIVGSFSAVDANINDYHGFALQAGDGATDNAAFSIKRTGEVWNLLLNSAADYETKSSYSIRVFTADNGTGTLGFAKSFTIQVGNINDAPRITNNGGGATATITLAENIKQVTTVVAPDADLPEQSLTFGIVGGVDAALFTINSSTGALEFNSAPDYEQPADNGANNQYDVVVQVSDNGSPAASVQQTLAITVTDTAEAPGVVSAAATVLSDKRAIFNASILTAGAGTVSARGFVYAPSSVTATPQIGGTGVIQIPVPGTTGAFDAITAGMTANTGYVMRAYAVNAVGTGYSAAVSFTSLGPDAPPEFSYSTPFTLPYLKSMPTILPTVTGGRMGTEVYRNVTTFAGTGTASGGNGGRLVSTFNRPWGLAMDSNGNIYVADDGNQKIRKITPQGVVSDFGTGFQYPRAVAVDGNDNVYAASNNHAIYKITQAGVTTVFAGAVNTSGSTDTATGPATSARFRDPDNIVIDPTFTYMLVADRGNNKIRRVELATGITTTFAGDGVAGTTEGAALTARFNNPLGLAFSPDGQIVYVSECGGAVSGTSDIDRIRKITRTDSGWVVNTLAGGTSSAGLLDGAGDQARFNQPYNLAVDPQGNLYAADNATGTVRKITPDGIVTTLAGSLGVISGSADDVGSKARFNGPRGLLLDPAGYLYVSDTDNNKIRRIAISGYEINHQLPQGVVFDSISGSLTGTPARFTLGNHYIQTFNASSLGDGSVSGNAVVAGNLLRLTRDINNQFGAFVVTPSQASNNDYRVSFTLSTNKASGGADGLSYSFAPDGSAVSTSPSAEVGTGSGLSLSFGTYGSSAGIRLYYGASKSMGTSVGSGGLLAYSNRSDWRGKPVPVSLEIDAAGRASVTVDGTAIFTNVQLPQAYLDANRSTWSHYFKSRTGSSNDMHVIDDLALEEGRAPGVYTITANNCFGSCSRDITLDVQLKPLLAQGTPFISNSEFKATGIELGVIELADAPAPHGVFTLIDNTGSAPVNGTFTNRPEGSVLAATFNGDTFNFHLSYTGGDGNDVVLTRVTAPGQKDHCLVSNFAGENRAVADLLRPYGLANDRLGNLYAADHNKHQIIKFTPGGNLSVLAGNGAGHADGVASTAKFYSPMGLALDSQGSIYVADWWTHRIRKVTQSSLAATTGTLVSTIGGNGTAGKVDGDAATSRFNYPQGIKVDALGKLYVTESPNNAVRMISTTGNVTTVVPPTGRNFPAVKDIIPDANGDFYVATGNSILKFIASPLALNDFSGNGTAGFADGPAGSARFSSPGSMARDFLGRIWVADSGNHLVRRVATDGSVETMAGSTQGNATGLGAAALFNNPTFISVDGTGAVYVSDSSNSLIRKIVSTARPFLGNVSFAKAGPNQVQIQAPVLANGLATGVVLSYQAAGGAAATISLPLSSPRSVEYQTAMATISGIQENIIYSYTLSATNVDGPTTRSGTFVLLTPSFSLDNPVIVSANGFNASSLSLGNVTLGFAPTAHQVMVVVDNYSDSPIQGAFNGLAEGSVVSASYAGNTFDFAISYKGGDGNDITLTRIPKSGQVSMGEPWRVTTVPGSYVSPYSLMGGPTGMVRDASGNTYVADSFNNVIWKIDAAGAISSFAGYSQISGSENGTGQSARFYRPNSLVIDSQGSIFVSDAGNHVIRKITPAGVVTTFAGLAGRNDSTDGSASVARFSSPTGMAIDDADNLYVIDASSRLRKITPQGLVSTIASSGFYGAQSVAVYSDGSFAVSNSGAPSIVKVSTSGAVTLLAGNYATRGSGDGTGSAATFGQNSLSDSAIYLSVDRFDNLYASDFLSNTIRKITREGVVTTIAGSAGVSGSNDGIALASRFNYPAALQVGSSGEVYVLDSQNKRIRRLVSATPPNPVLLSPTGISPNAATLRGTVNPNGYLTAAYFEYGLTTNYGNTAPVTLASRSSLTAQEVFANINGLSALQTYYYRLVATNVDGTSTTVSGSFPATDPPSFAAAPIASQISYHSVMLSSAITGTGGVPILEGGLLLLENSSPDDVVISAAGVRRFATANPASNEISMLIPSLKPNTSYRVRAFATSGAGTSFGPVGTFTTGGIQMETVLVGNAGNDGIYQGYNGNGGGGAYGTFGAVAYEYRLGKFEVTNYEYAAFLNAVDPGGINPQGIFSTSMGTNARGGILFTSSAASGFKYSVKTNMGNKPVNYVSWFDAARFANWTHNGSPVFTTTADSFAARERGAYNLEGATSGSFTKRPRTTAWIPTENEWFKAAYFNAAPGYINYDIPNMKYTKYATGPQYSASDADSMLNPLAVLAVNAQGDGSALGRGFRLNWLDGASWNGLTGNVISVGTSGGASYYGTYDQDGNVDEWTSETEGTSDKATRGGNWSSGGGRVVGALPFTFYYPNSSQAGYSERKAYAPTFESNTLGFRIARSSGPLPVTAPLVWSLPTSTSVMGNVATFGGGIEDDGGDPVNEYGVVASPVSINATPAIGGTGVIKFTISGSKLGSFTLSASGLAGDTSYVFRAYASNGIGTNYSTIGTFVTLPDAPSISYNGTDFAFTVGETIDPLLLSNSAGRVPVSSNIRQVTTVGGIPYGSNSVAVDPAGNAVLIDFNDHKIFKMNSSGQSSLFAGSTNGTNGSSDGIGAAARFSYPTRVTVAPDGTTYVLQGHNYRIRKITPQAAVTTLAGGTGGSADGQGAAAQFEWIDSGAIDKDGNLIVTDTDSNYDFPSCRIRKITPDGMVSTIYSGSKGFADGPLAAARFSRLEGVVTDPLGNIFVADTFNHRIRKITPDGIVSTLAGSVAGFIDGTGEQARLNCPKQLAIDAGLNLYVTEPSSYRIRRITQAGVVTTVAGSGVGGFQDGAAASAKFQNSLAVAVDSDWNILVTDNTNQRLRKVSPQGYTIKPSLPKGMTFDADTGAIGGKPTEVVPAANYTVTAYNLGGASSYTFSLAVAPLGGLFKPTVAATATSTSVTLTTAILGGEVTASESALTQRGVVYALTSANAAPEIGATGVTKLSNSGTTGVFSVNASGLVAGSAYSFRAYATSSAGTSYSEVGTFTTLPLPSLSPSTQTLSGTYGASITPTTAFTPVGISGAVTYSVAPSLPAGLSLDTATGVISGTPTAVKTATYTITGTGASSGSSTATVALTVAKASLTVIAENKTRAYGKANPGLTVTVSGLVNGDAPSVVSGVPGFSTAADSSSIAGSYTITPSLGTLSAAHYSFGNFTAGTLTITKAQQTITLAPLAASVPLKDLYSVNLSASSSAGLPVTLSLAEGSAATLVGTEGSYSLIDIGMTGTVTVLANQAGDANHEAAAQVVATFDVTKTNQVITFDALADMTFGDPVFPLAATSDSGLAVSYAVISGPATVEGSTLTITGAGTVVVTASQSGDEVYNAATAVEQSFNVAKKDQVVTFGPLAAATYGDVPITLAATVDSGLEASYTVTSGPATLNGNALTLTGAGVVMMTATQVGNDNYSPATVVHQTLTVHAKGLTVTGAVAADKVADETTWAEISGAQLVGIVEGDDVFLANQSVGNFSQATAGINLTVTTAMSLAGADSDNYTLTQPTLAATITTASVGYTRQEMWRFINFGGYPSEGDAADAADPDGDGLNNLLEYALGTAPNVSSVMPAVLVLNGANLEYTYTRSTAARDNGVTYQIEWCDTLEAGSWSTQTVTQQITSTQGTLETVKARVPAGAGGKRFLRLRVGAAPVQTP